MSSSKKSRGQMMVNTVREGDEDDDDGGSVGFSVGSSISGTSLIGTGQTAPSYCEVTVELCRAVATRTDGISYLCTKPASCGSKGHADRRHPSVRGATGYYKVAGITKATGVALRVFTDSQMTQESYLEVLAEERLANRRAAEAITAPAAAAARFVDPSAPSQETRDSLMSPGISTRRGGRKSLKPTPKPVSAATPQAYALEESYILLDDDDDTIESLPPVDVRTPLRKQQTVDLVALEAEQTRLVARSAEIAAVMKEAMTVADSNARTTPIIENGRRSARGEPVAPTLPQIATNQTPLERPRGPAPATTDPSMISFLIQQVQELQTRLDTEASQRVASPSAPPVTTGPLPPIDPTPATPNSIASTKVYAVAKGRHATSQGLYDTWAAASPHVNGVPGAVYKRCGNSVDATQFIQDYVEQEAAISDVEVRGASSRRVGFVEASSPSREPVPSPTGVGIGMDPSCGTGTHAFGVRTTLGGDMLHVLAPEEMSAVQRARLGEQIFDGVAQPGMSFVAETDSSMVEALTDALEALTASTGAGSGETLGGHKDSLWKKENRVSIKLITDMETLQEHMTLLQASQRADLELTKNAILEVYMRMGYSAENAERLALSGGIYRVSVDIYAAYISLHLHLLSLALKSGFPSAKLELDYHIKKLVALRKRLPSRIQVMMGNYTYLRDLMHSGWSCLALELIHRKAIQSSMAAMNPPAPGAAPAPGQGDGSCGWCTSCIHGMFQSQAACPWRRLSKTQAKRAAREAVLGVAQGNLPGAAAGDDG
jgi:hypothetical protein